MRPQDFEKQIKILDDKNESSTATIKKNLQDSLSSEVKQAKKPFVKKVVQATEQALQILDIQQSNSDPGVDEDGERIAPTSSLAITIQTAEDNLISKKSVQFETVIMPESYFFDVSDNQLLCAGMDGHIHAVDLNDANPIATPVGIKHPTYVSCVGVLQSEKEQAYLSSSAENVYVWNKVTGEQKTFPIAESKVIMSVIGLENGWVACADRIGRLYLFDPADPAKRVYEYDDGHPKFAGEERLTKLNLQNEMLIQTDRFGGQKKQFDLQTVMSNLKPHQALSETAYRARKPSSV
ncbi:MAG: WD40 repeat domain-containing protein [Gammaproteobacteria bacterium]|nr:WD40 repeat domain-containing protein [Gammaproteobacteria bacterium]